MDLGNINFVLNASCLSLPCICAGRSIPGSGTRQCGSRRVQKIIDHSGIVWNCWTGALAHLGVARANTLMTKTLQGAGADAGRVRAGCLKSFLTLWKDADPNIPILKQAKADYAKLQ